jgi:hypothetical protein
MFDKINIKAGMRVEASKPQEGCSPAWTAGPAADRQAVLRHVQYCERPRCGMDGFVADAYDGAALHQ